MTVSRRSVRLGRVSRVREASPYQTCQLHHWKVRGNSNLVGDPSPTHVRRLDSGCHQRPPRDFCAEFVLGDGSKAMMPSPSVATNR